MLDLLNTIPDLGAFSVGSSENIVVPEVLSPNKLSPLFKLIEFPNLFQQKGYVHELSVKNLKTTLVFGLAHRRPVNHTVG
jgi:hypothetical protein